MTQIVSVKSNKQSSKNMGPIKDEDSLQWSERLNKIGYSDECIEERILAYTKETKAMEINYIEACKADAVTRPHAENVSLYCVGSSIEGTSLPEYSDLDLLYVLKMFQCFEGKNHIRSKISKTFQFEPASAEGHGFIRIPGNVSRLSDDTHFSVDGILQIRNKRPYLSSSHLMNTRSQQSFMFWKKNNWKSYFSISKVKGPSTPVRVRKDWAQSKIFSSELEIDSTFAIPFHCPSILRKWMKRERNHEWPPNCLRRKVVSLPAFLVPVGQKGSTDEDLQWRICFSLSETLLVHSMNNTQKKVYVFLKILRETAIKSVCENITSFMIKNVVFWLCETIPQDEFTPEKLGQRISDALEMLRDCIVQRKLPYYMIPERNLFAGKILDQEWPWIHRIVSALLSDCGCRINTVLPHSFQDSINDLLGKMTRGYHLERLYICRLRPFSPDVLAKHMQMQNKSNFYRPDRIWFYLYNSVFIGLPFLRRFGLIYPTNPLAIAHEELLDPRVSVDQYESLECCHCRKSALAFIDRKRKGQAYGSNGRHGKRARFSLEK